MRLAATSCTLARNLPPAVVNTSKLHYTITTSQMSTNLQRSPQLGAVDVHEAEQSPARLRLHDQEPSIYIFG